MSSGSEVRYAVEPFDGSNYSVWLRRVTAIFTAKGFEKFLTEEAEGTDANEVTASKKAYALLLTFVSDKILTGLAEEVTCFTILKKLKTTYKREGTVSQILVRKRLSMLRKKKETSMREHLNEIDELVNQLKSCDVKVSDMDVIVHILMSLPAEYEGIKSAIENQPSENLTVEFVSGRLLDAEAMMTDRRGGGGSSERRSESDVAFAANPGMVCFLCKRRGHIAKNCDKGVVCFQCGRRGHVKRKCRFPPRKSPFSSETRAVSFMARVNETETFIVDSGATAHMCGRPECFVNLQTFNGQVACASKTAKMDIAGIGTVRGKLRSGQEIFLKDVLYVPDLSENLISVKQINKAGYTIVFTGESAIIKSGNGNFELCRLNSKGQFMCELSIKLNSVCESSNVCLAAEDAELWHRRLGHCGNHVMKKLGLPITDDFCENCVLSKQSANPLGKGSRSREKSPMHLIHTDLCGPVTPVTDCGDRYVLTLVDDYSRFCEVRLVKNKCDVGSEIKKFIKANDSVCKIRCDNAKEYLSKDLGKFLNKMGVTLDPCPPYTPQLNGVAERINRTLFDKTRALLYESKLPKNCWGYAVQVAAYIHNRIPSASIEGQTPYELKYSRKPDLSNIKVFGCDVFVRIPDVLRRKLDPKSKRMIFVGYSSMGYRVMDPITKRVTVSRNVHFNEQKVIVTDTISTSDEKDEQDTGEAEEKDLPKDEDSSEVEESEEIVRTRRETRKPCRYPEPEIYTAMLTDHESISYEDIASLPAEEQQKWKNAMDDEMMSMEKNKVWNLVDTHESDKHLITCKWVFKRKRDGKFKARLVARGFLQKEGLDYNETFSPVISLSSLRLVLVLILQENLSSYVMDVKSAFLNGELEETIFMQQPPGYDDSSGKVCKLNKSIYGLKQAPRQWFQKFNKFMLKIKFKQLETDPCVYIRNENNSKVIICLYVDDLLIAGSSSTEVQTVSRILQEEFQMSKSETLKEFLGIHIEKTENEMRLDQTAYIEKMLKRFGMEDANPSDTPMDAKSTSSDFATGTEFKGPYRELVGSLLYLAMTSRPDILFPVNCLSQLQETPTDCAFKGLKRVLRYLKRTLNFKLVYKKSEYKNLNLYVDADWASDKKDRKSISGSIIMLYNCPILWSVKKQSCITLSSTEAEVVALGKALQDLLSVKNVISVLTVYDNVCIYEDNQSAIKSILNENSSGRLKHIDVKLKFIREVLLKEKISLKYVPSDVQIADMFTKCLNKQTFYKLLNLCCIRSD